MGLEGAQDWDFIFRLVETIPAEAIRHVPEVLYHWRSTPDSTARSHRAKRYTAAAQIRAVTEHLQRVDIPVANVQVRDDLPCVQITYPEVPETDALSVIVVTPAPISLGPTSHGEILEVTPRGVGDPSLPREITPVLIHELRSYLLRSEVGLVGGLTTDQRGIIAGGGVIQGLNGEGDYILRGERAPTTSAFGRAFLPQDVSAVGLSCFAVRAADFRAVGGLDEERTLDVFGALALAQRIRTIKKPVIFNPRAPSMNRRALPCYPLFCQGP